MDLTYLCIDELDDQLTTTTVNVRSTTTIWTTVTAMSGESYGSASQTPSLAARGEAVSPATSAAPATTTATKTAIPILESPTVVGSITAVVPYVPDFLMPTSTHAAASNAINASAALNATVVSTTTAESTTTTTWTRNATTTTTMHAPMSSAPPTSGYLGAVTSALGGAPTSAGPSAAPKHVPAAVLAALGVVAVLVLVS